VRDAGETGGERGGGSSKRGSAGERAVREARVMERGLMVGQWWSRGHGKRPSEGSGWARMTVDEAGEDG